MELPSFIAKEKSHNIVIHLKSGGYKLRGGAVLNREELEKLMSLRGGFYLIVQEED